MRQHHRGRRRPGLRAAASATLVSALAIIGATAAGAAAAARAGHGPAHFPGYQRRSRQRR
jgi:hypothetical protein